MKTAYVTVNVLDMRQAPDHNAERVSQALFGDIVQAGTTRNGFRQIRQADGYRGWVDDRFLQAVSSSETDGYFRRRHAVIITAQARLTGRDDRPAEPFLLYYGTTCAVGGRRGDQSTVVLPDGRTVFVKTGNLRPINNSRAGSAAGADLVREAKKFIGVPYLWGGVTSPGFDCSGFVRAVGRSFGIYLPRDTKDQIKVGRKIDRDRIKTGDLLFFDRHVGLAVGSDRLIHASRGGSGVRLESITDEKPAYRADLDRDFVQARRIV